MKNLTQFNRRETSHDNNGKANLMKQLNDDDLQDVHGGQITDGNLSNLLFSSITDDAYQSTVDSVENCFSTFAPSSEKFLNR